MKLFALISVSFWMLWLHKRCVIFSYAFVSKLISSKFQLFMSESIWSWTCSNHVTAIISRNLLHGGCTAPQLSSPAATLNILTWPWLCGRTYARLLNWLLSKILVMFNWQMPQEFQLWLSFHCLCSMGAVPHLWKPLNLYKRPHSNRIP